MKKWGWGIAGFIWIAGITLVMGSLSALHNVSFFPDTTLRSSVSPQEKWTLTHVLGQGCKCSKIVYEYLLQRGPRSDVFESVVVLGDMPEESTRLSQKGFHVEKKEARSLASEKAVGVPFLLITSGKGEALYAGGYASSMIKENTPLLDLQILDSLRGGKSAQELPIFGCAISQRIQSLIDPLHFKYKETSL